MCKRVVATLVSGLCFLLGCQAGAPKFFCASNQTSYVGARDVNVTCSVTASPVVELRDMAVWWYAGSEPDQNDTSATVRHKVELRGGEAFGRYSASSEEGGDHETVLRLDIERAFPQMFRTYYFVANNSHGATTQEVPLLRDSSMEYVASARQVALSVLMAAAVTMLHLAAH